MRALHLQYQFFVVGERPFCVWDFDIKKKTLEFLENIDPGYFEYIANVHVQNIDEESKPTDKETQHAALAIRTAYSQALETLFALICAAIQAPYCVPAWMVNYTNQELRGLVNKIRDQQRVLSLLNAERLSWSFISESIFTWLVMKDKEKENAVKEGFSQLWSRFASDFLNESLTEEYNSIKHGLRTRSGGFHLAIGAEDKPGVPAPRDRMVLLAKSDFGTSYFMADILANHKQHIQLTRHHRNWNPEDLAWGLHLVSMSISNVRAALKILNGTPATEVSFNWPTDISVFAEPWKRSLMIGVTAMSGIDNVIPPEFINPFTKETILENYRAKKVDASKGESSPSPDSSV